MRQSNQIKDLQGRKRKIRIAEGISYLTGSLLIISGLIYKGEMGHLAQRIGFSILLVLCIADLVYLFRNGRVVKRS